MASFESDLEILNKSIQEIKQKYIIQKLKLGEHLNIFKILGLERNEVHLHSLFLGFLLNKNESHKFGHKFLDLFCQTTGIFDTTNENLKLKEFTADNSKLYIEETIGEIDNKNITGGRIDILITDTTTNYKIIIENKIDARDQKYQLARYYNYGKGKENSKNFIVLYLTKFGNEPSKEGQSTKNVNDIELKNGVDFFCISYKMHIFKWLDKCLKLIKPPDVTMLDADDQFLYNSIQQYYNTIAKLTNQTSNKIMRDKIAEHVFKNHEFLDTCLNINQNDIKKLYVETLNTSVQALTDKNGIMLSGKFTDLAKSGIILTQNGIPIHFRFINPNYEYDKLEWGIRKKEFDTTGKYGIILKNKEQGHINSWDEWWSCYFVLTENKNSDIFLKMKDGSLAQAIIDKAIESFEAIEKA